MLDVVLVACLALGMGEGEPVLRSLLELRPDIAAEGLFDPATVFVGSKRKMPWRCSVGHEYVAAVVREFR